MLPTRTTPPVIERADKPANLNRGPFRSFRFYVRLALSALVIKNQSGIQITEI